VNLRADSDAVQPEAGASRAHTRIRQQEQRYGVVRHVISAKYRRSTTISVGRPDIFVSWSVRYRRPKKGGRMNLFDEISSWPSLHARHKAAPLLREREQYLASILKRGSAESLYGLLQRTFFT